MWAEIQIYLGSNCQGFSLGGARREKSEMVAKQGDFIQPSSGSGSEPKEAVHIDLDLGTVVRDS